MRQGHHTVLVAIEYRDRSRPVGVNQVEGFAAKCLDTGVNQGIIVSARGFYNTAREKATHMNIRCLDMEEVESFPWLRASGIQCVIRKLLDRHWKFFPAEDGVVTKEAMEILTADGKPLEMSILTANAQRILNEKVPPDVEPTDMARIAVRVNGSGWLLRNSETGATTAVRFVEVELTYSVVREWTPFRLAQYSEKNDGKHITDVAVADLNLGDNSASLTILHKENKGGSVCMLPG